MKTYYRTIYLLLSLFVSSVAIAHTSSEQKRVFQTINAADGLADNSAQVIACTHTGRMIISTIGNLNFYDGVTFTHINTNQQYQLPLAKYYGNYHLSFDRFHHIWLKNTHSVTCVDLYMEQFVPDPEVVVKEMGCEDFVLDVFVDSIGDVWFLTEKGLYDVQTKKTLDVYRNHNIQEFDCYNGLVLTFYENGAEVAVNRETGEVAHQTMAYSEEDSRKYYQSGVLLRDSSRYYMIRNGEKESVLLSFDLPTLTWKKIFEVPYHLNNMAINEGVLYIASQYGYWTYDINSGEMVHYETMTLYGGRNLETNCNAVSFDKQGGMWIGTEERGVLYARPRLSPFTAYTWDNPKALEYGALMADIEQNITQFRGMQANCMYTDSRNWTWYGTTTGLYAYKTPDSEPLVFSNNNGLLNNVVHAVIEDKYHNIWLSTSYGISCIMFENDKPIFVNSFNLYDGVPNESFVNCKAMLLNDGSIVMQSIDHVVCFDPDKFSLVNHRKAVKLSPKLIRLLVNGNYVEPGEEVDGNVIIDRSITRAWDINLNSDQNSITLTFSGLNYFRPMQTCFRVRVKGIDDEWRVHSYLLGSKMVDSRGLLHLPMVGLKPGTYEVEVQTSMFPDKWEDSKPYVWKIHVNQPWWQTTGIYVLLAIIVFVLLIYNIILYGANTKMKARLYAEESGMVKKIGSFVERCKLYDSQLLAPVEEELYGQKGETVLASEFVQLMTKLMPYMMSNKGGLSMHKLSKLSGMSVSQLYGIFTENVYKSPRNLIMLLRLQKAADLLTTTTKTVEEISVECKFSSPNFFMGNFYHLHKLTPKEFRENSRNH